MGARELGAEKRGGVNIRPEKIMKWQASYISPNLIIVIKLRRVKLVGYMARMVDKKDAYEILVTKPEKRTRSENLGLHKRKILT